MPQEIKEKIEDWEKELDEILPKLVVVKSCKRIIRIHNDATVYDVVEFIKKLLSQENQKLAEEIEKISKRIGDSELEALTQKIKNKQV